jgi:aspartyl-tRNA synthetase
MPRTLIRDLRGHLGQTVTLRGWVNALRLQRAIQFVIVRDSSGLAQLTHQRGGAGDEIEQVIESLSEETAVTITGRVAENPVVNLDGLEIIPEQIEVLGRAETPLPIDEHSGPEPRLDWRFLDVRKRPAARCIFPIQTTLERAMREYAHGEGFTEMHTPKLMGTASESGAEVFQVGYFGRTAYLAQSPQFYKQMAIAAGIERVFEIGPVFRAEPSFTSRHSTEFTGIDVEMAWIDGVEDVMAFEERMLAHALATVADKHGAMIAEVYGTQVTVPQVPFPRLTMAEALQIMRSQGWDPEGHKEDLDPEGERGIAAHVAKQTGHEFVFVTCFPSSVRPFYHMRPAGRPARPDAQLRPAMAGPGDHHRRPARAPLRRARPARCGERHAHRADGGLPQRVPVRVPTPRRPGNGTQPRAHGPAPPRIHPRRHVPLPRT